jgi:hypothetical protein
MSDRVLHTKGIKAKKVVTREKPQRDARSSDLPVFQSTIIARKGFDCPVTFLLVNER